MRIKWQRVLDNPTVSIESIEGDRVRLHIRGMVCSGICVRRTERALRGIAGVRSASVDYEREQAIVDGAPRDTATYQLAIDAVVTGKSVRRTIECIARRRPSGARGAGVGERA